ncbi:MAG TPA: hypothetical protein VGD80_21515, partial [Kofleriaceae bacterium]
MRSTALVAGLALAGCRFGFESLTGDAGGGGDAVGGDDAGPDASPPAPRAIAVGEDFACTVRDGAVWCWGDDHHGQLGDGDRTPRPYPVRVQGIADAVSVVAGESHACALRAAGGVMCWGENESRQVGSTDPADHLVPFSVPRLGVATAIAAGDHHTCARLTDATAWCWGNNDDDQLGFTGPGTEAPQRVLEDVTAIATGEGHTCALRGSGEVWCWGLNDSGQLGDPTHVSRPTPKPIAGLTASAISLGGQTS